MFTYLNEDCDPDSDIDENRHETVVAVKQFFKNEEHNKTGHGGKVQYFQDVNGEEAIAELIVKFLETEGNESEVYLQS